MLHLKVVLKARCSGGTTVIWMPHHSLFIWIAPVKPAVHLTFPGKKKKHSGAGAGRTNDIHHIVMTSEDENRQRQTSNCWPLSFTSAFAVVCCTLSETDVTLVLTTMQTFSSSTAVVLLGLFFFMYPWKVHRKAGSNKCAHSSINRPWAALRPVLP